VFPKITTDWIFSTAGLWFLLSQGSTRLAWPYIAGVVALVIGVVAVRRKFANARGIDKLIVLGPLFLAIPMAIFGGDHFVFAQSIAGFMPSWIPAHLFWVYFVGLCLLAGALSLAIDRYAPLAAASFGVMLFLFVLLMDIPGLVQTPKDRFAWAGTGRDLTFGAGAIAFAAACAASRCAKSAKVVLTLVRSEIGIAAIFFAIEHFLHPEFKPSVPFQQVIPLWFPFRAPIGYSTGIVLLVTGVAIVLNKRTKLAAAALGLFLLLLVIVVYIPIVIAEPLSIDNGLNYFGDTLMYSGAMLCLAGAYSEKLALREK